MLMKVGIVGTGLLGKRHADRWSQLPVNLAGFFDVNRESAEVAASQFGGSVYRSLDKLARDVDILHIATPTPFHKEGVLTAAAQRKHVFCEKPLARTPSDACEMADACHNTGVRLYVGQTLRFFGQYASAHDIVSKGILGPAQMIRMTRAAPHPGGLVGNRPWLNSVETSGGAAMEGGVHDLDFARWCLGNVKQVFARGLTYRDDVGFPADHVLAVLHFKNGAVGHLEASWMAADFRLRQQFEIVGTEGSVEYDSHPRENIILSLRSEARQPALPVSPQGPLASKDDPYYRQLEHFLDALLHDKPFIVTAEDGVEAVRLCCAVLESVRTGMPVGLEEIQ